MRKVKNLVLVGVLILSLCACAEQKSDQYVSVNNNSSDHSTNITTDNYSKPEEYDEIVLEDERYCLCKKVDSGFDSNVEKYGIYDTETGKWAMKYRELVLDKSNFDFCSHGSGIFSYEYSNDDKSVVFLSAEKGRTFIVKKRIHNRNGIYFDDEKALVMCSKETKMVDGRRTPDSELFWMDTSGHLKEVSIPGVDLDALIYWYPFLLSEDDSQDLYAKVFYTEDDTYYIFIYLYDTDEYLVIDDQTYATRLNNSSSYASKQGDSIYIGNMVGDDGKMYFAVFDREGNVVQEPSEM